MAKKMKIERVTEEKLAEVYARITRNASAAHRTWFEQMTIECAPMDYYVLCAYADRVTGRTIEV